MFRTVSWQEAVWTCFALVALGFNSRSLLEAKDDLCVLEESDDFIEGGPRDLVANNAVRTAWIGVILQSLFAIIGLIAMVLPPNAAPQTDPMQAVMATLFVGVSAMLAWNSWKASRYRREVLYAIRKAEANGADVQG